MSTPKEMEAPKQEAVPEAKEVVIPAPIATGDKRIRILKHGVYIGEVEAAAYYDKYPDGIELAVMNASDTTIATAVFEAVIYDEKGNILDTIQHKEVELRPDTSRGVQIFFRKHDYKKVKSYQVRTIRTTTADEEKVQLRRQEMRTTAGGEKQICGTIKNISDVKADAALVASFYGLGKENVGTKVLVVRDLEPDTVRQFDFIFKPQEGDIVASCNLSVGELAG